MEGDQVAGVTLKLTVDKSKIGVPFRQAETVVNFESGLEKAIEAFGVGLAKGLIVAETKMTYVIPSSGEALSTKGKGRAIQTIKDDPEIYQALLDAINDTYKDKGFRLEDLDKDTSTEDFDNEETGAE